MKSLMTKKIPAIFITAAILFITVFAMNIMANAAGSYSPRLSAPAKDNKYYYSNDNIFYKYGYGMPNCTAYAYGRAYEILGKKPDLCPYNAEQWYQYNKDNGYYKYGSTPKLGAIACWYYNGGGGHVAVVEKIENNTITFSNSEWGGRTFYLTTADIDDKKAGGSSWWNFQGYIYIGDFSGFEEPSTNASDYQPGVYKTEVDDILYMRSGAGTSYNRIASIPNNVSLTVNSIQKGKDGYTWGYTSYNGIEGWVALDFCKFVSSEKPVTPPTTEPVTTEPVTTEPATTEPPTTVPNGILGDVNLDGELSIDDVTLIQKNIADISNFTAQQKLLADCNGDGNVSIEDVTFVQKVIAS